MTLTIALALVSAYVIGSIDFAVVVSRMNGVDITQVGSGNPGFSNVLRSVGRFPAAIVLVGDTMKGIIAAAMGLVASASTDPYVHWAFLAGFFAVVGHCYPIFHKFRGGRGVATGLGVLLFTVWQVGLIVIGLWIVLTWLTKTASIASLVGVLSAIPLAAWFGVEGLSLLWLGAIILLILWRHKDNIVRMLRGNEQKVTT